MGTDAADWRVDRARSLGALWWFVGVPFRPATHRNLVYLLLAFPLGLAYIILFTVGLSLGVGLAILLVGLGILAVTVLAGLATVSLEYRLTNLLLGTDIAGRRDLEGRGWLEQAKELVLDRRTWTALLALPAKFVLGLVSFVVVVIGIPTGIAMTLIPLYYDRPGVYVGVVTDRAPEVHQTIYLGWNYLLVGIEAAFTLGYWRIETLSAALVAALAGVVLVLGTLHVCNGLAWLWGRYVTWSMDGVVDLLGAALGSSASAE